MEAIIDTSTNKDVTFYGVFHVFCAERELRTSIMELKLAQELASVDQEPLLLVFLD